MRAEWAWGETAGLEVALAATGRGWAGALGDVDSASSAHGFARSLVVRLFWSVGQ